MATIIEIDEGGFMIRDDSLHPDLTVQWADFFRDRLYTIPHDRPVLIKEEQVELLDSLV